MKVLELIGDLVLYIAVVTMLVRGIFCGEEQRLKNIQQTLLVCMAILYEIALAVTKL